MYVGGNVGRTFLSFTVHLLFYIVCDVWDVVSLLCRLLTSCDCERKGVRLLDIVVFQNHLSIIAYTCVDECSMWCAGYPFFLSLFFLFL